MTWSTRNNRCHRGNLWACSAFTKAPTREVICMCVLMACTLWGWMWRGTCAENKLVKRKVRKGWRRSRSLYALVILLYSKCAVVCPGGNVMNQKCKCGFDITGMQGGFQGWWVHHSGINTAMTSQENCFLLHSVHSKRKPASLFSESKNKRYPSLYCEDLNLGYVCEQLKCTLTVSVQCKRKWMVLHVQGGDMDDGKLSPIFCHTAQEP